MEFTNRSTHGFGVQVCPPPPKKKTPLDSPEFPLSPKFTMSMVSISPGRKKILVMHAPLKPHPFRDAYSVLELASKEFDD